MVSDALPVKFPSTSYDWQGAREFFINGTPKPTFEEISARFGIPKGSVGRVSSQEDWNSLRQAAQDTALKRADAAEVILRTVKEVHPAPGMLGQVAIDLFERLGKVIDILETDPNRARKEADICNTVSFALLNTSNALKNAGIISFDALLKKNASEIGGVDGHGKWDKGLLQQINVTVQGMTARVEAAPEAAAAEPSDLPP